MTTIMGVISIFSAIALGSCVAFDASNIKDHAPGRRAQAWWSVLFGGAMALGMMAGGVVLVVWA